MSHGELEGIEGMKSGLWATSVPLYSSLLTNPLLYRLFEATCNRGAVDSMSQSVQRCKTRGTPQKFKKSQPYSLKPHLLA